MRERRDFKPHRPSATSFSAKAGRRLTKSPGRRKDVRTQQTTALFLFKDLYNEIMRPKDMRDYPRNEMPLGEKAQDEDLKGTEEKGICRLPEIGHLAHVLCL